MAGIYLHIPFCKQACHYCDFHFSTSLKLKDPLVQAILKELEMQVDYLEGAAIETIYFGGGTPSLLSANDLEQIFTQIHRLYTVKPDAEITLEANPDDIHADQLQVWKTCGINRLSIGIQSFHEKDLAFMNRAHNAKEALACIQLARNAGFELLTIDLIYGSPVSSQAEWAENLEIFRNLELPHLSSYALTVEPGTALDQFIKKGKAPALDEEKAAQEFTYLISKMQEWGYEHYEISNFSLPGKYARHNTAYWFGTPYLGIGPSAHSFRPGFRQWNVANNPKYIKAIQADTLPFIQEVLSKDEQYNEYIMTRLRTQWGCAIQDIQDLGTAYFSHFRQQAAPFIRSKQLIQHQDAFILSPEAKFLADGIAAALFI
ncbi:MAG: radical SAM family heme chaperone HemW [Saprospiraceae bacterium]|nr:radical SAM family heme chaperone HemW [Saprospiraceae bacterium]